MAQFNHMVTIAFEVISDKEDGSDITPLMLLNGLLKRATNLNETPNQFEWLEACMPPHDTYEMEDPQ